MGNNSNDSIQAFLNGNMDDFSDEQKIFIRAQFLREPWDEKAKTFALKLYSKSPSTYLYLLELKFKLPPISTIYQWHLEAPFQTGISEFVLDILKHQAKMMTVSDRRCLLVFDEMAIKSRLRYDIEEDIIHGYQDHGEFGRAGIVAEKVVVFLLRGLNTTWRQTICYYIGSPTGDILSQLIVSAVKAVNSCGMEIVGTCCDQSSINVQAYEHLMQNSAGPWVDVEKQRVFLLYDYARLFKSLRNIMLTNQIHIHNKVIDWKILEKIFNMDEQRDDSFRLLRKHTKNHIFPKRLHKLSIKTATQVFSGQIYSAIRMSIISNVFDSDEEKERAESTAVFFEKLNSLLDDFSTGVLYSGNAIQADLLNSNRILNDLKEAHQWVDTWCSNGAKKFPLCFKGFSYTLLATRKMWDYLKAKGQNFILLSHLSMDICKNEFIKLRTSTSRGSYQRNPPPWRIITNFKEIMFNSCVSTECSEYLGAHHLVNSTEVHNKKTASGIKVKVDNNLACIRKEDEHQDIDEQDLYYQETSESEEDLDDLFDKICL